jgi:hypothetical protein
MPQGKGTYGSTVGRPKKKQGYSARLDESLAMRTGAKASKSQSYKSRRDESKGMEKAEGRRAYASVKTMDKGNKMKRDSGQGRVIKAPEPYTHVV